MNIPQSPAVFPSDFCSDLSIQFFSFIQNYKLKLSRRFYDATVLILSDVVKLIVGRNDFLHWQNEAKLRSVAGLENRMAKTYLPFNIFSNKENLKQVHSDYDASEVGILRHFGTTWDILGHFKTIRKTF